MSFYLFFFLTLYNKTNKKLNSEVKVKIIVPILGQSTPAIMYGKGAPVKISTNVDYGGRNASQLILKVQVHPLK